ncbi:MAG: acyltransferase domain-containing protein, partial [Bacteroidota bacterium]
MMSARSNIVFLFSGQGSHYRGMGKELYQGDAIFRDSIQKSDRIISQNLGISLIDELYHSNDEIFDSILVTHPAIVAVELAMLAVAKDREIIPDAVAGVSLGEFAAAVAAGFWSGEEALSTCMEQARVISSHVEDGGMTVVIGNKTRKLLDFMDGKKLYHDSINFKGCFTVSGSRSELDKLDVFLGEQGMVYQRLEVEYAFHSPLMDTARIFWQDEKLERSHDSVNVKMYSAFLEGEMS